MQEQGSPTLSQTAAKALRFVQLTRREGGLAVHGKRFREDAVVAALERRNDGEITCREAQARSRNPF